MSESPEAPAKPMGRLLTWAIVGVALVGVAGAVYIIVQSSTKTAPVVATVPLPETPFAKKVSTPSEPTPAPDYTF